jgi:geranylgeranyl pyrophosphate synthase
MEILNCMDIDKQLKQKIISIFYREVMHVGLAEMQDVHFEYEPKEVSEEDILRLYRYKTANYTFSLPLKIGVISAGADDGQIRLLDQIGEQLGVAFQIKDDELGIFAPEEKIGKSVGIDIRDNKKTIYRHYLMQRCGKEEIIRLNNIFGNPHLTDQDLAYVQGLLEEKGISGQLRMKIKDLEEQARRLISRLDINRGVKDYLLMVVDYNTKRQK